MGLLGGSSGGGVPGSTFSGTLSSGQFKAPDGTAGAPSYSFSNYTNKGMYATAAGLDFAVGGTITQEHRSGSTLFYASGVNQFSMDTARIYGTTDNTYDLGTAGLQFRTGYFGTSVIAADAGAFRFTTDSVIKRYAAGQVSITKDGTGTAGGTTGVIIGNNGGLNSFIASSANANTKMQFSQDIVDFYKNSGVPQVRLNAGVVTFAAAGWGYAWASGNDASGTIDTILSRAAAGVVGVGIDSSGGTAGSLSFTNATMAGKATTYNNVATTGWGVPAIYGSGRSLAQTGDVASVATYTVGAADGSFIISCNVLVTAYTAGTQAVKADYTDEGNTARTVTFTTSSLAGTLGVTIGAAGPAEGIPLQIRAKAATVITIKTVGTAWNGTYNVEGSIQQTA